MPEDIFKTIVQLVKKAPKPGKYSVEGEAAEMPNDVGLEVNNFGRVELPLKDPQASELVKVCNQAPFGKNELTLVDPAVRDSYQLDPSQVSITNAEWNKNLVRLVKRVGKSLGCKGEIQVRDHLILVGKKISINC